MEKKGLDRCFMQYGIRQNDMRIIEQVCEDHEVDSAWLEEHVLKVYQDKKNSNVPMADRREVESLLKQALKKI
ncbi:MAG: hypothetical protein MJZ16_12835 [Bacteroidales bacterium]|nr:hypothetical protein [Bacteroidales bacterium]